MSSSVKMFLFAFIMCLSCGVGLSFTAESLKERQTENRVLDMQKNILKALNLYDPSQEMERDMIKALYESSVEKYWVTPKGKLVKTDPQTEPELPIFINKQNSTLKGYAIPFKAYGLWSWVKGYIAFNPDGNTVEGFTVYSHQETPGLGGECDKPWFENQFKGKKILNRKGMFVSVGVVKGKVVDVIKPADRENYVDGMSGATITSKGIQNYLKDTLKEYEPYAKKLRKGS